jgi:hypothetical protein
MSENRASPPSAEFLKLIDRTDPTVRQELGELAEQADIDHKQMSFAVNWLLNYGDRPSTDTDEQLYWEDECRQIAEELEIHSDPDKIDEIIDLYESRASLIGEPHGQA